jgi:N-acetylglutamate synthase-like GNAT family acetyltransferase
MLTFEPITKFERGIIFQLLSQSFAELLNDDLEKKIKQFDDDIFDNPDTVGACVFVSTLNGKVIGMASWDPRQWPQIAMIGYNCILPDFRGNGFGKAQIKEILKRLKAMEFKKVIVITGDHPFFLNTAKMYSSCGFMEIRRCNEGRDPRYGSIDYEIELR